MASIPTDTSIELPGDGPLLLLGCGNMGGAMLRGWLDGGLPAARIVVQEPAPSPATSALLDGAGVSVVGTYDGRAPSIILVAVKPQVVEAVFPQVAAYASPDTVVLSVAAGRTIASFQAHLPAGAAVVRTIPNT
ncbi:MAG: NAD(P)-binding domain-containing protein, partial [Pseudomonadota bacterium]